MTNQYIHILEKHRCLITNHLFAPCLCLWGNKDLILKKKLTCYKIIKLLFHFQKRQEHLKENKAGTNAASRFGDCPICFDELGQNPIASTKCGHVFCLQCLQQALTIEKRCPKCRRVLKGPSAYHPLYV